jgi:hypothetical protein
MSSAPLLDELLVLLNQWRGVFRQRRSCQRAIRLALAHILTPGRRLLSRLIATSGRQDQDWTADYKLFNRSPWQANQLFQPVIERCVEHAKEQDYVVLAGDFTHLSKSGKHISNVSLMRDPLSPPYRVNLILGLRFFQLGAILPLYRQAQEPSSPRSIPVCFAEVPVLKKPGRKASQQQRLAYREAYKKRPASRMALEQIKALRAEFDRAGAAHKSLLTALDGNFCNAVFFGQELDRIQLLCRCRKDARLHLAAPKGQRRFYAAQSFTPEQIRQDPNQAWRTAEVYHGGAWRSLTFKELNFLYWPKGAKRRPLRLLVIAPTPYRHHKTGALLYRHPAYLLSTDRYSPAKVLIQAYFDRWQIEVNHREEKTTFGVGQAQVRHPLSVPRQPAFNVALYAMLLLAALQAYGSQRSSAYLTLPKWRRNPKRPSCLDIVSQLRLEMQYHPDKLLNFLNRGSPITQATLRAAA